MEAHLIGAFLVDPETEIRLLRWLGHDLGGRKVEVVVRVVRIADRIFPWCDVEGLVRLQLFREQTLSAALRPPPAPVRRRVPAAFRRHR